MSKPNEIKVANKIRDALIKLKTQKNEDLIDKLKSCQLNLKDFTSNLSKLEKAYSNVYSLAAQRLRTRVSRDVNDLYHSANMARQLFETSEDKIPDFKSVFEEVVQLLYESDGDITIDDAKNTLSMETDPIELDGLYLGRFCISLCISEIPKLCRLSPYNIIALEPNPAATNSDVTHPHVSCEKLCEGDGTTVITNALVQARLADFFTIVKNVLETYNPDSPYVSLDDWEGISCYDCGYTVAGDECYYCENCEHDFCSSCSTYCQICDTTICLGCSFECPDCEQPVCHGCIAVCSECEETVCKNCINEEGLCHQCQEKRKEQENEEKKEEAGKPKANPTVQSDSVGEAIVHA